jgi:putative flippase GtrA
MTALLDPPVAPPVDADNAGRGPRGSVAVDVVVPVYNEERDLGPSVRRLHDYLSTRFPVTWRITIADNASTDATPAVARQLADELPGVRVVRLDQKGRGRALRHTWLDTEATVVAYMDVDLSTDLAALLPLVAPLLSGHSDIAIGSRLARDSRVVRGTKREVISRCYNLLLRATLRARFSDAQCGFKAMRADRARILLPHVQDTGWFWDTELLVLAERAGLRIHEVPVDWTDDPDSRVDIVSTAVADLRGIARLGRGLVNGTVPLAQLRAALNAPDATAAPVVDGVPAGLPRQLGRFAGIGVLSTVAYIALYVLLKPATGAQLANALALLITAVANTAANRRFTFGTSGRDKAVRHQAEGLVVFGIGLGVSSGSLALLHAMVPQPPTMAELAALVTANLLATVIRFVMLKSWVFHPGRREGAVAAHVPATEGIAS